MLDEIFDKMLEECWMKVYVVCTCHPTYFIQHASLFSLLFDIKSKLATGMFLPMILSELVDSDDEKPWQGKMREWIKRRHQLGSFQNIIKELIVEDRYAFKEMIWVSLEEFKTVLKHIDGLISPLEIQGGHRTVLSDQRLTLTLRFLATKVFVESFKIRSPNIQNNVRRMKRWKKQRVNPSNMKTVLDEHENVG